MNPDYAFSLGNVGGRDEYQLLFSPVGHFVSFLPIFQYRKYGKFSDLIYTAALFRIMNINIATKKYGFQDSEKLYFNSIG